MNDSGRPDLSHRLTMHAIRLGMVVAGLLLALDILYLGRGSLELFPTPEQQSKVRVVTAVIAAMLILVEIGLWVLLRSMRRGEEFGNRATR